MVNEGTLPFQTCLHSAGTANPSASGRKGISDAREHVVRDAADFVAIAILANQLPGWLTETIGALVSASLHDVTSLACLAAICLWQDQFHGQRRDRLFRRGSSYTRGW